MLLVLEICQQNIPISWAWHGWTQRQLSSPPSDPTLSRGRGMRGPRWVAVMLTVTHLKSPSRPGLAPGAHPAGGPVACEPQGSHPQALIPRDTGPGPPSGKKDYVPFGLHPVPREGNWVHPKNNQTCKQLQHANVFYICGPNNLKVQLFFHCPNLFVIPEWGGALTWSGALLGSLSSSTVTWLDLAEVWRALRTGCGLLAAALTQTPPAPGQPESGKG